MRFMMKKLGSGDIVSRLGQNLVQPVLDDRLLAVQGDDADMGPLPLVLKVKLGDRDIIFSLDSFFETVHDLPLVFEGPAVREKKLQGQIADDHDPRKTVPLIRA